jgi:hypothetical protein
MNTNIGHFYLRTKFIQCKRWLRGTWPWFNSREGRNFTMSNTTGVHTRSHAVRNLADITARGTDITELWQLTHPSKMISVIMLGALTAYRRQHMHIYRACCLCTKGQQYSYSLSAIHTIRAKHNFQYLLKNQHGITLIHNSNYIS